MPAPASEADLTSVCGFFAASNARHLRCRKRANTIVIESGPAQDPIPHLRLRKLSPKAWGIDSATHTGRWERMPLQGPALEILSAVAENFPWLLAPIAGQSTDF